MQTDVDFAQDFASRQINHRDRSFIGDEAHRVNAHPRSSSGRTGHAVGFRPAPTPIAHIGPASRQHNIEGCHSDIEQANYVAVRRVEFGETVGQVQRRIKPFAVA